MRFVAITPEEMADGEKLMTGEKPILVFKPNRGYLIAQISGSREVEFTPNQARQLAADLLSVAEHSERLKEDPTARPSVLR